MISFWDGRWFEKTTPTPPPAPSTPADQESAPQYIAEEPLSALRVVRASGPGLVRYARPPEVEASAPIGITSAAAGSGESITIVKSGEMGDASWSWTPGAAVLLGANGMLTQTQPSAQPYLVVMGQAVSATTIVVRIGLPILISDS